VLANAAPTIETNWHRIVHDLASAVRRVEPTWPSGVER
jgi:hypothetical protein